MRARPGEVVEAATAGTEQYAEPHGAQQAQQPCMGHSRHSRHSNLACEPVLGSAKLAAAAWYGTQL